MAIQISSPGQIGRFVLGLDVAAGDMIVEASIEVTSNSPDLLTGENATVSDAALLIGGVTYEAGAAIIFTIVAAANMPVRTRDEGPYYLKVRYRTDAQDPDHDDLTYALEVEVYPEGILTR